VHLAATKIWALCARSLVKFLGFEQNMGRRPGRDHDVAIIGLVLANFLAGFFAYEPTQAQKEMAKIMLVHREELVSSAFRHLDLDRQNSPIGQDRLAYNIRKVRFAHVKFAEPFAGRSRPVPLSRGTGGLCLFRPRLRGLVAPYLLTHSRLYERVAQLQ
jgi:hypothetical protein